MVVPFLPFKVEFEGEVHEVLAIDCPPQTHSDNPTLAKKTDFLVALPQGHWWISMYNCQPVKED